MSENREADLHLGYQRSGAIARWRHSPDVAWVDSDNRIVLVDLIGDQAGKPLAFDVSASVIWRAIDDGKPVLDIVSAVAAEFAVFPGSIRLDVEDFLILLARQGLIVRDETE